MKVLGFCADELFMSVGGCPLRVEGSSGAEKSKSERIVKLHGQSQLCTVGRFVVQA